MSHFVRVFSVDDSRIRTSLGSGDRKVRTAWLRAIRKAVGRVPESDIEAREEAAEQMLAGSVTPGTRPDGHVFGYAFLALCEAWADKQGIAECCVTESDAGLWALAAQAGPNPFGVPQSPYGTGHVGWHEPKAIPKLRKALAADRKASLPNGWGRTAESVAATIAEVESVMAHAEKHGRGVIVSWAV